LTFGWGSRKAVALATLIAAVPIAFVFIVSQRALLRTRRRRDKKLTDADSLIFQDRKILR